VVVAGGLTVVAGGEVEGVEGRAAVWVGTLVGPFDGVEEEPTGLGVPTAVDVAATGGV